MNIDVRCTLYLTADDVADTAQAVEQVTSQLLSMSTDDIVALMAFEGTWSDA